MKFSKTHIDNLKKAQKKRWADIKARDKQSQTLKQQRRMENSSTRQKKYTPKTICTQRHRMYNWLFIFSRLLFYLEHNIKYHEGV